MAHARAKKNQQVSVIDVGSSFLFLHDFFVVEGMGVTEFGLRIYFTPSLLEKIRREQISFQNTPNFFYFKGPIVTFGWLQQ